MSSNLAIAKPTLIWLTGLSGSGKTSIARVLYSTLKPHNINLVWLDGDDFRNVLGDDLGHTVDERIKNAFRLARMCQHLVRQNISVISSTMSLYPEIWSWNRSNIPNYLEIYLKVPHETLMTRDPKGIYNRVLSGKQNNVVGVDLPFHEPDNSDLTIDNSTNGDSAIQSAIDKILSLLQRKIYS